MTDAGRVAQTTANFNYPHTPAHTKLLQFFELAYEGICRLRWRKPSSSMAKLMKNITQLETNIQLVLQELEALSDEELEAGLNFPSGWTTIFHLKFGMITCFDKSLSAKYLQFIRGRQ